MKQEELRNHGVWLKCFIKAMKESLKTGMRFYPRDDDIFMLEQIKEMIQKKPEVTEEWIIKKAEEIASDYGDVAFPNLISIIKKLFTEVGVEIQKK